MITEITKDELAFLNTLKDTILRRRAHNIKQRFIAAKLGCTTSDISNIERYFSLTESTVKTNLENYCNAVNELLTTGEQND